MFHLAVTLHERFRFRMFRKASTDIIDMNVICAIGFWAFCTAAWTLTGDRVVRDEWHKPTEMRAKKEEWKKKKTWRLVISLMPNEMMFEMHSAWFFVGNPTIFVWLALIWLFPFRWEVENMLNASEWKSVFSYRNGVEAGLCLCAATLSMIAIDSSSQND